MAESQASTLFFDPDKFPDNTLKAFAEFVEDFELRYDANFPDPPKVSLDSAVERWKMINVDKKPSLEEFDSIVEEWKSHDRVAKFLGLYSSRRLVSDWKAACPEEKERKKGRLVFVCPIHVRFLQANREFDTQELPVPFACTREKRIVYGFLQPRGEGSETLSI